MECPNIGGSFVIYHWQGGLPRSVVVHVLAAASGTNTETGASPIKYQGFLSSGENSSMGKVLSLRPESPIEPPLLAANDYKIVIDEKLEYWVHEIKMIDRANLGCPIESAMVNSCKVDSGKFIDIDGTCGRRLP
jgi:hypothetical protein